MSDKEIVLFQFEQCPFCEKVRQKLKEKGIEYKKVNMPHERDSKERKELFEKSGVWTVPVIKIGDEYLGDSSAIIERLDKEF